MYIVHILIHVKPDQVEAFKAATIENAQNSRREPGIARFDFSQQLDDPTWFVLVEAYRAPEDQLRHRETEHYKRWREKAEPMMAEPRVPVRYQNVFPEDAGWG